MSKRHDETIRNENDKGQRGNGKRVVKLYRKIKKNNWKSNDETEDTSEIKSGFPIISAQALQQKDYLPKGKCQAISIS